VEARTALVLVRARRVANMSTCKPQATCVICYQYLATVLLSICIAIVTGNLLQCNSQW